MSPCRNCGNINTDDAIFCRSCGTKLATAPSDPIRESSIFDMPSPSPYSWKTGEFRTENESRRTMPIQAQIERPGPLAQRSPAFAAVFRCPSCSTHMPPLLERKISTAGWITFAVLLVTVFPLFWIGLLIREDVPVCQVCKSKLALGPYR